MLSIHRFDVLSEESVTASLRRVPLLLEPDVHPYRQATITWLWCNPEILWPTSTYVLKPQLVFLRELREIFQRFGIDIMKLNHGVQYHLNGQAPQSIIPPIIEESTADNGRLVILDGRHRIYLARQCGMPIRCLCVQGVDPEYPLSGLPVSWNEVQELDAPPPHNEKKRYRSQTFVDGRLGMATRRDLAVLGIGGGVPRS